jgi:hypothetical protein
MKSAPIIFGARLHLRSRTGCVADQFNPHHGEEGG